MSSFTQIIQMARSSILSNLSNLDVVSNNLANINTTGYKSTRLNFQELLTENNKNGVQESSTQSHFTQGSVNFTGNPLDIMISGHGFFAVEKENGDIAYTRDGSFNLDSDSSIVDGSGNALVWDGEIPADANKVEINATGSVRVNIAGVWQDAGQIQLYEFNNPSGMRIIGDNLRLETVESGAPIEGLPMDAGFGYIIDESLESSNVDYGTELVRMITLQRSFDVSIKNLQQTDLMLGMAINMRR
ncbi:MAG: flagellar hook-basal body complex protein [Anaerolineaceae bacterium]|nr:flagellar hook-basal body complex protein [Anaerolineaceae bacterium]